MGQCKSKVQVLDEGDRDKSEESRLKKSKLKWRKSKGYSLSASLDCDLDLREAAAAEGGEDLLPSDSRSEVRSGAAVLLSYNVREERKRKGGSSKLEATASSVPPPQPFAGGEDVPRYVEDIVEAGGDDSLLAGGCLTWERRLPPTDRSRLGSLDSDGSGRRHCPVGGLGTRAVDKLRLVPPPSFSFGPPAVAGERRMTSL
jgi:hypothetical protein